MNSIKIVIWCVISATAYGVIHDQITIRLCNEYFTVAHPPIFPTESETLLAFVWGVISTWWVGLLLGVALAIAARTGRRSKRSISSLRRPIIVILLFTFISAIVFGAIGWILAECTIITLNEPFARDVSPDRHSLFLADLWAHLASYLTGIIGGLIIVIRVWRSRLI